MDWERFGYEGTGGIYCKSGGNEFNPIVWYKNFRVLNNQTSYGVWIIRLTPDNVFT